jgi:hypothetical protein
MSFFIYVGNILIIFHNGSSVFIIPCILYRPLRCVVRACENLLVFIHIVTEKRKCIINDSIKTEYLFIKSVTRMLNARYARRNFELHMVVGRTSSIT